MMPLALNLVGVALCALAVALPDHWCRTQRTLAVLGALCLCAAMPAGW